MPTYTYKCLDPEGCDLCSGVLEIRHSIHEAARDACPHCQKPVKRIIVAGAGIVQSNAVTQKRLDNSGMARYERVGDGLYEKTGGPSDAPARIDKRKLGG